MTATTPLDTRTLYDRDYFLWLTATVEQLQKRRFSEIDLENLVEEIDYMAQSQKQSIHNQLIFLLEYLLKLVYWESERERNARHWKLKIIAFRDQINDFLADSPSLKPYICDIFTEAYAEAHDLAAIEMEAKLQSIPKISPFTLEQTLDDDWFPIPLESDD
jgi:Domain of unknown function DUF29